MMETKQIAIDIKFTKFIEEKNNNDSFFIKKLQEVVK